jgi:hypothetical protein
MPRFRSSSSYGPEYHQGCHRFEHWYRDNTVYFMTARCRDRYPAFAEDRAKAIFWDRFEHYTSAHGFTPWVTTLIDNHYHTLGHLEVGEELGPMMRKLHGSVAKLVNDRLPTRRVPFWRGPGDHDYFDGCLRDERQCRCTYRYVLTQSVRHGLCRDHRQYPHTQIRLDVESAIAFARHHRAFMEGVHYPRYEGHE